MTDPERQTQEIMVGDTVAYRESFLKSIGQEAAYRQSFLNGIGQEFDNLKRARGKVKALITVHKELTTAEIDWDVPYLPNRVDIKNLIAASATSPAK